MNNIKELLDIWVYLIEYGIEPNVENIKQEYCNRHNIVPMREYNFGIENTLKKFGFIKEEKSIHFFSDEELLNEIKKRLDDRW